MTKPSSINFQACTLSLSGSQWRETCLSPHPTLMAVWEFLGFVQSGGTGVNFRTDRGRESGAHELQGEEVPVAQPTYLAQVRVAHSIPPLSWFHLSPGTVHWSRAWGFPSPPPPPEFRAETCAATKTWLFPLPTLKDLELTATREVASVPNLALAWGPFPEPFQCMVRGLGQARTGEGQTAFPQPKPVH